MTQISLNKSVLVYSPNITRLFYVAQSLEGEELDLKLCSNLQDVIVYLDEFEVEKFVIDLDFQGDLKQNLKVANAIFTTYFYKYEEDVRDRFVAITYDEITQEFLDLMEIPYRKNTEFDFNKFLKFEE